MMRGAGAPIHHGRANGTIAPFAVLMPRNGISTYLSMLYCDTH